MYNRDNFFYVNYSDLEFKFRPYFRSLFDTNDLTEDQLEHTDTYELVMNHINENRIRHIYQHINCFFMFTDQYEVIEHRYLRRDKSGQVIETPWQMADRVATFVALAEPRDRTSGMEKLNKWYPIFLTMLLDMRVSPNTPTWSSAGIPGFGCFACAVVGNGDSLEEISKWYSDVLFMNRYNFGIGHSLHKFRPKNAPFGNSKTKTKSPLKWLNPIQEMSVSMQQGDSGRGGANMVSIPIWHPAVVEFINYKKYPEDIGIPARKLMKQIMNSNLGVHTKEAIVDIIDKQIPLKNFNMSILITNKFMQAVREDKEFELKFELSDHSWKYVDTIKARQLWDDIVFNAYESGDPGLMFFDRINKDNHLLNIKGAIYASNPCVTGDTLISVADGRNVVPIKQLAQEGADIPVYCQDYDGSLKISIMRNPRMTQKHAKIYKITLDTGDIIRATENHKFWLTSKEYKKLSDLKVGDSLVPLHKINTGEANFNGYWVFNNSYNKKIWEHRIISEYNTGHEIYNNEMVHHKNYIKNDNSLKNLKIRKKISKKSKDVWKNKHDYIRKQMRKGWDPEKRKNLSRVILKKSLSKALDQEYKAIVYDNKVMVEKQCEYCSKMFDIEYIRREVSYCSKQCSNFAMWEDEDFRKRRRDSYNSTIEKRINELRNKQTEVFLDLKYNLKREPSRGEWRDRCKKENISTEMYRESSPFQSWNELTEYAFSYNHRIVSIEFDGYEDVYNGTVDTYHNYFIGGFHEKTKGGKKDKLVFFNTLNCGEQFLMEHEICDLWTINLMKHINFYHKNINWAQLRDTINVVTRMADNLITQNEYPKEVPELERNEKEQRRIGIDYTGLADAMFSSNIKYGSDESYELVNQLYRYLRDHTRLYSAKLGKKKGNFPLLYKTDLYNENGKYSDVTKCPECSGDIIRHDNEEFIECDNCNWAKYKYLRNIELTTQAPTGTRSRKLGVSFGIEPHYMKWWKSNVMEGKVVYNISHNLEWYMKKWAHEHGMKFDELMEIVDTYDKQGENGLDTNDYLTIKRFNREVMENWIETYDLSPEQHIEIQSQAQQWVSNAVSKTINFDDRTTIEDVDKIYKLAWEKGLKGITIYRKGSHFKEVIGEDMKCPECGSDQLLAIEGCMQCKECSWAKCEI